MARIYHVTELAAFERVYTEDQVAFISKDIQIVVHTLYSKQDAKYTCFTDTAGNVLVEVGDKTFTPKVWSHRPFPVGFPVEALVKQFETKHVQCLGDYDQPVDLSKSECGRYLVVPVQAAWMVYVELAIEHFNTPL